MPVRTARATWKGGLKTGTGSFKTESGLTAVYNYSSRFGEERASNPEELLAEVKRFAATLLPEMHAVDPTTFIEFDALSAMPGFDTHGGDEIAELGRSCSATHEFGNVSFGTEASLFHGAGIATIICGPGHIDQAHQPNEWVALDQLALCEAFMRRLADQVCVL